MSGYKLHSLIVHVFRQVPAAHALEVVLLPDLGVEEPTNPLAAASRVLRLGHLAQDHVVPSLHLKFGETT